MRTARDKARIRKQTRKRKLQYLRRRLEQTTAVAQRKALIEKIRRLSPAAPVPEK
jgi:hypothetical protein